VRRYPGVRPRNVTATVDERAAILDAALPHLRLWILLCSDLAIRSGTAARIAPEHYNPTRATLSFSTKCGERLTLPVTDAIRELIETCDAHSSTPYVRQLWQRAHTRGRRPSDQGEPTALNRLYNQLRRQVGITRQLTLHDLRRTTAVAMLEHTKDPRDVQALLGHRSLQATIWYLDHNLRPVSRATLELLKRPPAAESKEQSA
jgi:integrase